MEKSEQFSIFAVNLYQQAEIAETCLWLQDNFNINVNLLLYSCWLGMQGFELCYAELIWLLESINIWNENYIKPLRKLRRMLKHWQGTEQTEVWQHRQKLKALELDAENVEQKMLVTSSRHLLQPHKKLMKIDKSAQISQNLQTYLQLVKVEECTCNQIIRIFLSAC